MVDGISHLIDGGFCGTTMKVDLVRSFKISPDSYTIRNFSHFFTSKSSKTLSIS